MSSTARAQQADHRIVPIRPRRSKLLAPVIVLTLTIGAIAGVWLLVGRANASREAQVHVSSLALSLTDLEAAPFAADPAIGGSPTQSTARIRSDQRFIASGLTISSQVGVPPSLLGAGRADLARIEPVVSTAFRMAIGRGGLAGAGAAKVLPLERLMLQREAALRGVLDRISRADAARAEAARTQTMLGTAGAMLLLLAAFAFFYFRSVTAREAVELLVSDREALLRVSRGEARTDKLTNLGNRRALASDLARAIAEPSDAEELLLVMFDLDGFKLYNDTFGHSAGDALLQRLGGRLAAAAARHSTSAYRMGGDEFCVLARWSPADAERLLDETISALEDSGEGWQIGCSHGVAWIPSEAWTESQALNLADERMYANKAGRSSTSRQITDALLQVITEQNASLDRHVQRVSELAGTLAVELGQPELEVQRIRLAAMLHDIGKTAIPAAILDKPGPLDEAEWEFLHRHPAIGARIASAAPALAGSASLIQSSHERMDGQGYPDGLAGEEIPLGARIIAVCDAFEAMTSDRPYHRGIDIDSALEELKRGAGTQFDPAIVKAFCDGTTCTTAPRRDAAIRTSRQLSEISR